MFPSDKYKTQTVMPCWESLFLIDGDTLCPLVMAAISSRLKAVNGLGRGINRKLIMSFPFTFLLKNKVIALTK